MKVLYRSVALSIVTLTMAAGANAQLYAPASPVLPSAPFTTTAAPIMGTNQNPPHYRVPAGYDADVALHPYTSDIGPCPEGAIPSTGCRRPKILIKPSHYEQPPFTR